MKRFLEEYTLDCIVSYNSLDDEGLSGISLLSIECCRFLLEYFSDFLWNDFERLGDPSGTKVILEDRFPKQQCSSISWGEMRMKVSGSSN
jgi:hypothetical protein